VNAGQFLDARSLRKEATSMCHRYITKALSGLAAMILLAAGAPAFAQEGKLLVRVRPTQAYVFVDGRAIGDGGLAGNKQLLINHLSPGEHTVRLYNYGYKPQTHKVTIEAKKTGLLEATLEAIPGTAPGPHPDRGWRSCGGLLERQDS
jgi:hypothetical protein